MKGFSQSVSQSEDSAVPPKAIKLRESCDSCLLAKVKCSKSRPICARCLSNGATCGYSPSSRAGRKHRNASANEPARITTRRPSAAEFTQTAPPTPVYLPMMHPMPEGQDRSIEHPNHKFFQDRGSHEDSRRRHSGMDEGGPATQAGVDPADFFPNPPFGDDFAESLEQFSPQAYFRDLNCAVTAASPSISSANHVSTNPIWTAHENHESNYSTLPYSLPLFQISPDLMTIGQATLSSTAASPTMAVPQANSRPGDKPKSAGCDCFAVCLQALQTLHNHSWLPSSAQPGGLPFDVVLTINQEAMRGCAAMLDCDKCVSKTGSSISTMLLATIFGKIISLYGSACFFRFGPSTGNQAVVKLALGAYTLTGEDRRLLEMEIILLELRKVESILLSYQERFRGDASQAEKNKDETGVYNALTHYLDKNLRYILDFLQARKGTCS